MMARPICRTLAAAAVLSVAVFAQESSPPSTAGPAPKPLVPVAASTFAADPARFLGQTVTMFAPVERRISPGAFSVDQDRTKSAGFEVLVLTRALHGVLAPHVYVTVIGEVVRFEAADIRRRSPEYLVDLPADVAASFGGRPVVLASAVIDFSMTDLTKKPPPPMTPEEAEYDSVMKRVGPAFGELRKSLTSSSAEAMRDPIATLGTAFANTEAFWKARRRDDAVRWSREARELLAGIERAAAGGQWDAAKTSTTSLQETCGNCHGVYRERHDDGSYRIKSGKAQPPI